MGRRSLVAALLGLVVVAATGCSSDEPAAAPAPAPAGPTLPVPLGPADERFYESPATTGAQPGKVIWARPIGFMPTGMAGYTMLYWSTTVSGEPTAVSGMVYRSTAPQPAGASPTIVAWAHGTTGMADTCAPSKKPAGNEGPAAQLVVDSLAAGNVFVVTDYEGLGTPGEHPYLVARSHAQNVMDSIRAAAEIVGAGPNPTALALGESQGGAAVLVAAETAAQYAPEVDLRGVVAISPASHLDRIRREMDGGPYMGFTLMAALGYETAYPDLERDQRFLNKGGKDALAYVKTECIGHILETYANQRHAELGFDKLLGAADFRARLAENEPGHVATTVPIMIAHGDSDTVIPVRLSRQLVTAYCNLDTPVVGKFYRGLGHGDVLPLAYDDIAGFVQTLMAGNPVESSCANQ